MDSPRAGAASGPNPDPKPLLLIGGASDLGIETLRSFTDGDGPFFVHYGTSLNKIRALQAERPGLRIHPIQADLGSLDSVQGMLDRMEKSGFSPEHIVHCAAPKARSIYFRNASWSDFDLELNVQLRSIVLVLRKFLPAMAKRKRGKMVFVLSSYTFEDPPVALTHYITAKYALLGLMKSLAVEYSRHGIGVNAVSPSTMATSFLSGLPERMVEILAAQAPGGRLVEPREVVPTIRFLLSSESDSLSGANILVTERGAARVPNKNS